MRARESRIGCVRRAYYLRGCIHTVEREGQARGTSSRFIGPRISREEVRDKGVRTLRLRRGKGREWEYLVLEWHIMQGKQQYGVR